MHINILLSYLFIISSIITSCSLVTKKSDISNNNEDLFHKNEEKYMILFYLKDCVSSKNSVLFFEKEKKEEDINLYLVECESSIGNNKGDDLNNIGAKSYEEININSFPTLLILENNIVEYELKGFEEIRVNYKSFYFK